MIESAPLVGLHVPRRRFLQAAGLAGVSTLLPGWVIEAAATASPIGPTDGILVVITMNGGNDGLNTFVPIAEGAYYDARRGLSIKPDQAIHLNDERGLHPQLSYLKALWDQGRVAVIEGVGLPDANLSHFLSMDRMMAANSSGLPGSTGWLGRVLDGLPDHQLKALSIGTPSPLLLQGRIGRGNVVPVDGGAVRSINRHDEVARLRYDALLAIRQSGSGLGAMADEAQAVLGEAIELAADLQPHLLDAGDEPAVVRKMRLAANLINANIGTRVLTIDFGNFDTHAQQLLRQGSLLGELDAALRTFFTTLNPIFANQVLIVGLSEFGRRVRPNANGTEHGAANTLFAVGARVNGGFFGQAPSLTALDRRGNQQYTVDHRQFCANLATTWLGADDVEIFGARYTDLGFLRTPGRSSSTTVAAFPSTPVPRRVLRSEVTRLYLAYFGRIPDEDGLEYWTDVRHVGRSLNQVSAEFAASEEFRRLYGPLSNRAYVQLVYRNVLDRNGDVAGINHWTDMLDAGGLRGDVMVGFSQSDEFKKRTASVIVEVDSVGPIGRLYRAYFLRPPDEAGLDYWINSGLDRLQASEQFATSDEFRSRYGQLSDEQFVSVAYRNVLDRAPDLPGFNHWVGFLRRGGSRGQLMLGFSNSPEFVRRVRSNPTAEYR